MRIKLDENLPARLADFLLDLGHDVDSVPSEGLQGRNDSDVWQATEKTRRFLITQDLDFSDLRQFVPGTHHGILLLRLRRPTRKLLFERVRVLFETEEPASWEGSFIVATESKLRAHQP